MIFVFLHKINFDSLSFKLSFLLGLMRCQREVFLTNHVQGIPQEILYCPLVDLSLQNFLNVCQTVFRAHETWLTNLRLHHLLGRFLMQFLPPHVITAELDLREHVSELLFARISIFPILNTA